MILYDINPAQIIAELNSFEMRRLGSKSAITLKVADPRTFILRSSHSASPRYWRLIKIGDSGTDSSVCEL